MQENFYIKSIRAILAFEFNFLFSYLRDDGVTRYSRLPLLSKNFGTADKRTIIDVPVVPVTDDAQWWGEIIKTQSLFQRIAAEER